MTTVPPMRPSLFRNAALSASAFALICFCSCERHRAEELSSFEENGNAVAAGHEHLDKEKLGHGGEQSRATTAMANLAEGIQGLVQHMRSEQQVVRSWVETQSEQQKEMKTLLETISRALQTPAGE